MNRILIIAAFLAMLFSCSSEMGGRIDQKANVPAPSPVTIKSVRSISGGAVIKVVIPDDPYLKGVVAIYERNGVEVKSKISRYVDSLFVEGLPNTSEHVVKLYSFNVNEVLSEPVETTIVPLAPAISTVKPTIYDSFGGVKIDIQGNESKSDLAVCILKDNDLSDLIAEVPFCHYSVGSGKAGCYYVCHFTYYLIYKQIYNLHKSKCCISHFRLIGMPAPRKIYGINSVFFGKFVYYL